MTSTQRRAPNKMFLKLRLAETRGEEGKPDVNPSPLKLKLQLVRLLEALLVRLLRQLLARLLETVLVS